MSGRSLTEQRIESHHRARNLNCLPLEATLLFISAENNFVIVPMSKKTTLRQTKLLN